MECEGVTDRHRSRNQPNADYRADLFSRSELLQPDRELLSGRCQALQLLEPVDDDVDFRGLYFLIPVSRRDDQKTLAVRTHPIT